jgi:hypothetical protein
MASKRAEVKRAATERKIPSGLSRMRDRGSHYTSESQIDESYDPPLQIGTSYSYVDVEIARKNFLDGKFYELALMVDLAMQDGKISSLFRQRTASVASLYDDREAVHIDAPNNDPFTLFIRDWWKQNLWSTVSSANVRDFVRDHAIYGFYPAQVVKRADSYRLLRWQPALIQYQLSERHFKAITSGKAVLNPQNREYFETMRSDGNKWIVSTSASDLYRCWVYGCAYNLVTLWAMKQFAISDWQNFVKAWSSPKNVLTQKNNLSAPDKAVISRANKALLQGKQSIILPEGCLFTIAGAQAGTGSQVAGEFVSAMNLELSNMIVGMSTDHVGGAYDSMRIVFEGVAMGTTREDISSLNNSLFPDVVSAVTQRMFGAAALAPRVWIDTKTIAYNTDNTRKQPASPSSPTGAPKNRQELEAGPGAEEPKPHEPADPLGIMNEAAQ